MTRSQDEEKPVQEGKGQWHSWHAQRRSCREETIEKRAERLGLCKGREVAQNVVEDQ